MTITARRVAYNNEPAIELTAAVAWASRTVCLRGVVIDSYCGPALENLAVQIDGGAWLHPDDAADLLRRPGSAEPGEEIADIAHRAAASWLCPQLDALDDAAAPVKSARLPAPFVALED